MGGIKKALPVIGTGVGAFFGGPVGASIGGAVGGLLSGGPDQMEAAQYNSGNYDISRETEAGRKALTDALAQQKGITDTAAPLQKEVIQKMGEAAAGRGPSLAEAQMKAAQDRTLAQQLGALQSQRGGNAASNARLLMQAQGSAGRNLAQDAAIARLNERNQFMTHGLAAQSMLGQTSEQQMRAAVAPKMQMQNYDKLQTEANTAARNANISAGNQFMGSIMGGLGQGLTSMMGSGGGGGFGSISNMFKSSSSIPSGAYGNMDGTYSYADPSTNGDFSKLATGGHVKGPGTETSDSIPARLSDGEFVVRAAAVKRPGMLEHLKAINEGRIEQAPGTQATEGIPNSSEKRDGGGRKKFSEIIMAQHQAHGSLLQKLLKDEA